jgi:hypothetical protein
MNGHPNAILEPSGDHVGFEARAGDARSTTRRVVPSATRTAQRPVAHGYAISVPLGDQAYAGLVTGAPALAGRTSRSPVPSGRATRMRPGSPCCTRALAVRRPGDPYAAGDRNLRASRTVRIDQRSSAQNDLPAAPGTPAATRNRRRHNRARQSKGEEARRYAARSSHPGRQCPTTFKIRSGFPP